VKAYRLKWLFNTESKRCFDVALVHEDDTLQEAAKQPS
jgi:hypothetical protein